MNGACFLVKWQLETSGKTLYNDIKRNQRENAG